MGMKKIRRKTFLNNLVSLHIFICIDAQKNVQRYQVPGIPTAEIKDSF